MKNWRKVVSLSLAIPKTMSLLTGIGAAAEEKEYEPTTLTFWNGFTSTDGEVLQQIVDDFNETNEWNITIEMDVMPWATFNEKLPAAIAAGNAPDFVLCSSGYYVPVSYTHLDVYKRQVPYIAVNAQVFSRFAWYTIDIQGHSIITDLLTPSSSDDTRMPRHS